MSKIRKLRHSEVPWLSWEHTVNNRLNQDRNWNSNFPTRVGAPNSISHLGVFLYAGLASPGGKIQATSFSIIIAHHYQIIVLKLRRREMFCARGPRCVLPPLPAWVGANTQGTWYRWEEQGQSWSLLFPGRWLACSVLYMVLGAVLGENSTVSRPRPLLQSLGTPVWNIF